MAEARGGYAKITEVEKALVYAFLDKIKADEEFRAKVQRFPYATLGEVELKLSLADFLRPSLLETLGKLRRVALEEVGIDVGPYREIISDNGYPLPRDDVR